jgi:hypothetical protein
MKNEPQQPLITLVVALKQGVPVLVETLTSLDEILELEMALMSQESEPLKRVQAYRQKQIAESEEFADFVEGLLSQPFVKPEVQEHAIQWFKSRMKIEAYQKAEDEASRIIAQYAFQIYLADQDKIDFFLTGPKAKVRVRIIDIEKQKLQNAA